MTLEATPVSAEYCTNCGRALEVETVHAQHRPGGECIIVRLEVFASSGGWLSRSTVLGTAPPRPGAEPFTGALRM